MPIFGLCSFAFWRAISSVAMFRFSFESPTPQCLFLFEFKTSEKNCCVSSRFFWLATKYAANLQGLYARRNSLVISFSSLKDFSATIFAISLLFHFKNAKSNKRTFAVTCHIIRDSGSKSLQRFAYAKF